MFIFSGLLLFIANAQAENIAKNTTDADLELIELLGGFDDENENELDVAMETVEINKQTVKKPTSSTNKSHPAGGEE